MLTYDNLTKSQIRWVEAMVKVLPQFAEGGAITLKECARGWDEIAKTRADGEKKIGVPNWLYNQNKIHRGVYFFPAKGADPKKFVEQASAMNLQKRLDSKDAFEVKSEADEEFLNELLEAGIDVKVAQPQTESPL